MAFNWSDYISVAEEICNCLPSDLLKEAKKRTAISRAYYGVFIQARNYVDRNLRINRPDNMGTHQYIIYCLKVNADDRIQTIGNHLDDLRLIRSKADYENEFPGIIDNTVVLVIAMSKRIEAMINDL